MATLHQVTKTTKKLLSIAAVAVVILIIGRILFGIGVNVKERFFPTPPPLPTVLFGTLPPLEFPPPLAGQAQKPPQKFSLTVNTVSGALPQFLSQVKVYKLVKNQATLTSVEEARKTVAPLGFSANEKALTQTLYQWADPNVKDRIIQFEVVSKNFVMTSDFYHDKNVLLAKNLPKPQEAQNLAVNFLSQLKKPADFDLDQTKISFFRIEGTSLIKTTSLSNAQIVRVDLFPKPIDQLPIFYASPLTSPTNFLIGSSDFQGKIVETHFFHQPVEDKEFSTYPIKTVETALEELKQGQAYVTSSSERTDIVIKKVTLGYYVDDRLRQFLLPIFVFEGNNDFVAYVSAIEDSWINPQTENSPTSSQ